MEIYRDSEHKYWARVHGGKFKECCPDARLACTAELISRAGHFPLRPYGVQNLPSGERVLNLREPTLTRPVVPLFPAGAAWGSKALRMAIPETHRVITDKINKANRPLALGWLAGCYQDLARGKPSNGPTLVCRNDIEAFVDIAGRLVGGTADASGYFAGQLDWSTDYEEAGMLVARSPERERLGAYLNEDFVFANGRWVKSARASRLVVVFSRGERIKDKLYLRADDMPAWDRVQVKKEAPVFAEWLLEQR